MVKIISVVAVELTGRTTESNSRGPSAAAAAQDQQ
jgi:hypothetical protein